MNAFPCTCMQYDICLPNVNKLIITLIEVPSTLPQGDPHTPQYPYIPIHPNILTLAYGI